MSTALASPPHRHATGRPVRLPRTRALSFLSHALLVVVAGAAVLGYIPAAQATDYDIDTSWTVSQINQFLDATPGTDSHPYGTAIPAGGDTVLFAAGVYNAQVGNWFKVRTGGTSPSDVLTIQGAGWGVDGTRFVGSAASGEGVMQILADNIEVDGFRFYDDSLPLAAVVVSSPEYTHIRLRHIHSIGFAQHYAYYQREAAEPIYTPSIIGENLYLQGGGTGFHFMRDSVVTLATKYVGLENITIDSLTGVGIDAPAVIEEGQVIDVRGQNDWFDNLIINTDAPFNSAHYPGFTSPEGTGESENGADSLVSQGIGSTNMEFDTVADLMLDPETGAPLPGSPIRDLEPVDLGGGRTAFSKGYVGAVAPVGGVPTVSQWGLLVMTLLVLIAGTLVFMRSRRCPQGTALRSA